MTDATSYWAPFKEAILNCFGFLTRQYGFHWSGEHVTDLREMYVQFDNATTRVTVLVGNGSGPVVTVGQIEQRPSGMIETEAWDIGFVRHFRSGGPEPAQPRSWPISEDESLRNLAIEAESLFYCAHDILLGDFSLFPRIRPLAEENKR